LIAIRFERHSGGIADDCAATPTPQAGIHLPQLQFYDKPGCIAPFYGSIFLRNWFRHDFSALDYISADLSETLARGGGKQGHGAGQAAF